MTNSATLKKFIKFETKIKLITVQNVAKVPTKISNGWLRL